MGDAVKISVVSSTPPHICSGGPGATRCNICFGLIPPKAPTPAPADKNAAPPPPAIKPSNPKDARGIKKASLSCVPAPVLFEVGIGMQEGACKYGRHNYRAIGVRGSVYYDAAMRHLMSWWEGEDVDPDSGLNHITKAITSLIVLRDAMIQNKFNDDRPPKSNPLWLTSLNAKAEALNEKYPDPVGPYTNL